VNNPDNRGDDRRGWHVDKTVSISHVLTTATILFAGMWYLVDQDKRISANAQSITHNASAITQQENRNSKALSDIKNSLDRITNFLLKNK
jgi:hypothetical protein